MVLLTGAAAVVAVAVIGFAMFSTGQISAGDLRTPKDPTPESAWNGRSAGPDSAPVTLEVYSDFQCPACDLFATEIEPPLMRDYVVPGKVRLVYRDYAFIGQESLDAAVAARCADDQGKFWPYHDYLFANQKGENKGTFSRARLIAIGDAVGVDQSSFQACLGTGPPLQAVKDETLEGQAAGVASTPTLILDGQTMQLTSYPDLAAAIDAALAAASPAPSAVP